MNISCQISTPEVYRKPGVTSYQDDLEQTFATLKTWGYEGMELTVRNPSAVDVATLIALREKYGLAIPMVCTGEYYGQDRLSFADPDDTIRGEAISRFKKGIDVAQQLGCFINLGRVRGGYTPEVDQAWTRKRIFEALQEVTTYAEQKGVVIVLEPVNTLALNYINTTQEGIELVKQLNSPSFQLMVDTAHLHIEDRDIRKSMEEGAPYIKYVHLADSNRKYLGGGVFDFASFITILEDIGYTGWLGVEVFPVPDKETAFKKSIEHIKPML